MGITERREREKQERRKTILGCAKELIIQHGVQHVSMDDIARKAELSKATVYLYFASKEVLLSEICEEGARAFMDQLKPFLDTGFSGIEALRCVWRGYTELFSNLEEMIIIFQVRSLINPNVPLVTLDEKNSTPDVGAIINTIRTIIEQCKAEGVFDPNLDSGMATRLLLSVFSILVENAAHMSAQERNSPAIFTEMHQIFQILIWGFAKEGIDRGQLTI